MLPIDTVLDALTEFLATGLYLADKIKSDMYLPTAVPDLATGQLVPNIMVGPNGQPIIGADGNPVFNSYEIGRAHV